jgi:hypothetical protein
MTTHNNASPKCRDVHPVHVLSRAASCLLLFLLLLLLILLPPVPLT